MILVIGGANQGKKRYVRETFQAKRWCSGGDCSLEELCQTEAAEHFELFLRRELKAGREPESAAREVLRRNPDVILVSDEIGCGLVPVDAFEREYRECVGRVMTGLAKEADAVHRVICGIGTVLRG